MGWIEDRKLKYRYQIQDGSIRHFEQRAADETPDTYTFEDGEVGVYCGFEPDKIEQTHSVSYEQNGRKAMRVRGKDGTIQHISKSKLHYMKTGRIENQYTKGYQEHLDKKAGEQIKREAHAKKEAKARGIDPDQALKDSIAALPDGEFVSDGKSFIPAPKQK